MPKTLPELEADRLLGLLRHFRIPHNDPDPWAKLAIELARKHYPHGAPNQIFRPKRWTRLAELYGLRQGPVAPRGRPRGDQIACLHNSVWFYQQDHPAATDKQAIIAVLRESARRNNVADWRVTELLPRLQQGLSRYRAQLRRQLPDPEAKARARVDQLERYLTEKLKAGQRFTQNMLVDIGLMKRRDLRKALDTLLASGRVAYAPFPCDKRARGARKYLHPVAATAPSQASPATE